MQKVLDSSPSDFCFLRFCFFVVFFFVLQERSSCAVFVCHLASSSCVSMVFFSSGSGQSLSQRCVHKGFDMVT